MARTFVPCLLLSLLLLCAVQASQQERSPIEQHQQQRDLHDETHWTEVFNFSWYNGSSTYPDNSENLVLFVPDSIPENEVEDYLLVVELMVPSSSTDASKPNAYGSFVAIVLTSEMDELGTVQLNTFNRNSTRYVASFFCWSPTLFGNYSVVPSFYQVVVVHPFAQNRTVFFDVRVSLVVRRLQFNRVQHDTLPIASVFWYFDVNGTKDGKFLSPVEVTVRTPAAEHREGAADKLLTIYYGCPGRIGATTTPTAQPEIQATFDDKVRMTLAAQGQQKLRPGRWFVEVTKPADAMNATLLFEVTHGLPYSDYGRIWGMTSFVFILVCPTVCLITFVLVWLVQPASYSLSCRACPPRVFVVRSASLALHDESEDDDDDDDDNNNNNEGEGEGERGGKYATRDYQKSLDFDQNDPNKELKRAAYVNISEPNESTGLVPSLPAAYQPPKTGDFHSHFWQLTIIVSLVFFTPAIQILIGQMLNEGDYGDRDICYYNDFCERPDFASGLLMFAFNNVYSNIGYLIASLVGFIYIAGLRYWFTDLPKFMPNNYSILFALCVCLFAVGVNSGTYHLCPSRIGFQVDSSMMLGFALLSLADLWRRYINPRIHSWRIYMILASLLFLNYIGTVIDTYPGLVNREQPKLIYRGILTAGVGLFIVLFFVWVWFWSCLEKGRKTYSLICALLSVPIFVLLWTSVNSDLSQTLLGIFVLLYAFSVIFDLCAQLGMGDFIENLPGSFVNCCFCRERSKRPCFTVRRLKTAVLMMWLASGWLACGISAMYYFNTVADTNKNLTPAESRNMNSECIVADYYSTHDLWHFLSAVWLLFQLLINAHIGHGLKSSRMYDRMSEL